ncbi:MAG: FAD-dependent oxidoreductase [Clostridia bacterium]|nr:FAD-dependent oxidoreductase [Clostridia bacterium]
MKSVWNEGIKYPQFKTLKGDITADVLIIGGGIAGILCAKKLADEGIDYVLLEANRILNGNTQGTTAKITVGHGLIYSKTEKSYGTEFAKKYYQANKKAMEKLFELAERYPCDFETKDLYIYSKDNPLKLKDEYKVLKEIGAEAELCQTKELPFATASAVKHTSQGQFNPLKMLYKIAVELNIYENSHVHKIKENTAFCADGTVTFKKVIFAAHFPFVNRMGLYYAKLYQNRSYAAAIKNAAKYDGMYVDENDGGFSFRNYKEYLIVAGGGAKTGKSGGGFYELERDLKKFYPDCEITHKFAAQDCMSLDGIPYIGRYSLLKDNYFVATGFNKWGMTSAMAAADLLCDMVKGKPNEFSELFNPHRSIFHKQLLLNIGSSAVNLLTPSVPRCSHLGCALKWNKQERVWECPCHGSRFTEKGDILDNPAVKGINR